MKKIIATDYDGTLTIDGIPPRVIEAIERFRAEGNLFGVVTGRDKIGSYQAFAKDKRFGFDFILALNGALALDADGNTLYEYPINGDQPYKDTTLARALLYRICELTGQFCGVCLGDTRMDINPDFPEGGKKLWVNLTPFEDIERDVFDKMHVLSMLNSACENEEICTRVTAQLLEEFGDYVFPQQNGTCIDIPVCGMDKGEGIAKYAALMGVDVDNIWTAGDNYNDLPMLRRYHGCAMASGVQAAKDASEFICRDIAEVVELAMKQ
jgi:HAD superfamily hydrolase (TIGR01484 family)